MSQNYNNRPEEEEVRAAGMDDNQERDLGDATVKNSFQMKATAVEARPWFMVNSPNSGDTYTVPAVGQTGRILLNNSSALAAYTVKLPNANYDGHLVEVLSVGGVTALTMTPSSAGSYIGTMPTAITAGKKVSFSWNKGSSKWIVASS